MIILKSRLFPVNIDFLVDHQGRLIVGNLKNGGQADVEHVGRLFEVSQKFG